MLTSPMAVRLFIAIFIEGFCSLGAEVIALRQIVPHLGSSIVVTAPTIGFFLLALALGYQAGAKVDREFAATVQRNFLLTAALAAGGLSTRSVNFIFALIDQPLLAFLVFMLGVLCPIAYLMGQTVPVLTNVMRHERAGEKSGTALFWSTLGSFLGAVSLSLIVMQHFGISAAVGLTVALLLLGGVALGRPSLQQASIAMVVVVLAGLTLRPLDGVTETAYAQYQVSSVELASMTGARAFMVNHSPASLLDDSEPPRYARYIELIRRQLLDDYRLEGREILVLGAGGFTLSHREPKNRYTFVDIDPQIRHLAEAQFLATPARGEFIVDDARRFVSTTPRRFDVLVVDVYSNRLSIPGHLVTREFWQATAQVLKPGGVMLANLVLDSRLESAYARNLLATVEAVYGRCAVEVVQKNQPIANVLVSCAVGPAGRPAVRPVLYADERSAADFDAAGAGR